VQQRVSVDGMVAGPDGETDVLDAVTDFSASDRHDTALLDSVDEVLTRSHSRRSVSPAEVRRDDRRSPQS
jgi:hypothetical protein